MHISIVSEAELVTAAASALAGLVRRAAAEHGRCLLAVSGGHTPWSMLRLLAREDLPWDRLHVFQVDERVAPEGHPDRNLTHLRESLLAAAPLPEANLHAMPVNDEDLEQAPRRYAGVIDGLAGTPAALDIVHLGLGPDGHTASLVPGDPVLDVTDRDVALSGVYQGRRRMTMTYPLLNRARRILWLVTGANKADALPRLLAADPGIPAGRVRQDNAECLADRAAAAKLTSPGSPPR
jgi:6-phosphogluconolactonase